MIVNISSAYGAPWGKNHPFKFYPIFVYLIYMFWIISSVQIKGFKKISIQKTHEFIYVP